jgi:hypothetical protein
VKWIPTQASDGLLAWAEELPGYDKVFAVLMNAKKMAGRALGSVSSGG